MLAIAGPLPAGPGWAYEFKWDGVRAMAVASAGRLRIYARSGAEITRGYPELGRLGERLSRAGLPGRALFDGEIVVMDEAGRPSFMTLAERMHVRDPVRTAKLAAAIPVTYLIFDLLELDGQDLTGQPYQLRRELLEALDLDAERWLVPPRFEDGPATVAAAHEYQLEGVMAKRLSSVYRPGLRSPDWVKVKQEPTEEFVVGGWRPGERALGALLVGSPGEDGLLDYCGRVGGGISGASERQLLAELRPLAGMVSPFREPLPREDSKDATWVRPELVVEVKYGQRTPDGKLRFPRFLRLRPDLTAGDLTVREAASG
jgi:bifunctional non-homologous end joining protein LigD